MAGQTTQPAAPTQKQLEAWLDQLSDPSFEVRQQAVKQLYSTGPAALSVLKVISQGDDFEAALRARKLIERIQKLYLVGAQVEIAVDRRTCKWDQPISLSIKIVNPSSFPIHLPFLTTNRELLDVDPLARQMGNMLDAADFLSVIGPSGRRIELTIDDFRGHQPIEKALDVRVYDEPDSWLAPQASFALTLQEFNRGFTRYRMLDQGDYLIQFAYVPEWDEARMRKKGIGKVTSNQVIVTVTEAAPKLIRRAKREMQSVLRQEGDDLILTLTNIYDRTIGINLNLGGLENLEHAHVEWIWNSPTGNKRVAEPFPDAIPLNAEKFNTLEMGETVEVFRTTISDLVRLKGFEELMGRHGNVSLAVAYVNKLDHAMLARSSLRGQPLPARRKALLRALPRPTFVGAFLSSFIEIDLSKYRTQKSQSE